MGMRISVIAVFIPEIYSGEKPISEANVSMTALGILSYPYSLGIESLTLDNEVKQPFWFLEDYSRRIYIRLTLSIHRHILAFHYGRIVS